MGCDIHCYREKQVGGVWIADDEWKTDEDGCCDVDYKDRFSERNYILFGLLSKGVRFDCDISFKERGVPFDASDEYKAKSIDYDSDGHSHSYIYLGELKSLLKHIDAADLGVNQKSYVVEDLNKIIKLFDGVEGDNHRIVFFFDN